MRTPPDTMNTADEFVEGFNEVYPLDAETRLSLRNCLDGRDRWHEQSAQARIEAARAAAYLAGLRAAKRAVVDAMVGKSVDTPLTQIADIAWRAVQRLINAAEAIEEAAKR